jgi:hypothetical protein
VAILRQNIALATGIKALPLVLALAGHATMWMAVFADMGASLIVVFNGLRVGKRCSQIDDARASMAPPDDIIEVHTVDRQPLHDETRRSRRPRDGADALGV